LHVGTWVSIANTSYPGGSVVLKLLLLNICLRIAQGSSLHSQLPDKK